MKKNLIIVRGGGDLATGVIHRLYKCGYQVLILESKNPTAIRRMVSFSEAIYDGEAFVEGVLARRVTNFDECKIAWAHKEIPIIADETGELISELKPSVVIDAIIAKRNIGTNKEMAPLTIALGPGFTAGYDVDYVIETKRGHRLGTIIDDGEAAPNSGIPGLIGGFGKERVIHSPESGIIKTFCKIGDIVEKGQVIAEIDETKVTATITGVLRGILRDDMMVPKGMKMADIDPRKEEKDNCYSISDKARCLSGSVIEVLLSEGVLPL